MRTIVVTGALSLILGVFPFLAQVLFNTVFSKIFGNWLFGLDGLAPLFIALVQETARVPGAVVLAYGCGKLMDDAGPRVAISSLIVSGIYYLVLRFMLNTGAQFHQPLYAMAKGAFFIMVVFATWRIARLSRAR
ncbi:MAG: hypothetical protein GXP49_08875 [Deltaproteobacteria bacterium]|nr:hypothetical protein [Deltaproteobacteria bacterium]